MTNCWMADDTTWYVATGAKSPAYEKEYVPELPDVVVAATKVSMSTISIEVVPVTYEGLTIVLAGIPVPDILMYGNRNCDTGAVTVMVDTPDVNVQLSVNDVVALAKSDKYSALVETPRLSCQ